MIRITKSSDAGRRTGISGESLIKLAKQRIRQGFAPPPEIYRIEHRHILHPAIRSRWRTGRMRMPTSPTLARSLAMSISLDSLLLTPQELEVALRQVRELAYFKWEAGGRPADRELDFWCAAEREWIASSYVPHRPGDNRENAVGRPPAGRTCLGVSPSS